MQLNLCIIALFLGHKVWQKQAVQAIQKGNFQTQNGDIVAMYTIDTTALFSFFWECFLHSFSFDYHGKFSISVSMAMQHSVGQH